MKRKNLLTLLLSMIICICSLCTFTANAADSFAPVEVSVASEKESYKKDEKLTFEVKVTNNNDYALDEVKLNAVLPKGFAFVENQDYKMQLNAKEAKTYKIAAKFDPDALSKENSPKTGDNGVAIYVVILGAALILAFKTKQGKKVLSVMLAVGLCSSILPTGAAMKTSASDQVRTVTAYAEFKFDSKSEKIRVTAEFKADDLVTIDTASYEGPNAAGFYSTDKTVDTLTGGLKNSENVEKLSYVVKDIKETVVKSGSIDIASQWTIKDFGLVVGYNGIVVTAVDKNGAEHNTEIILFNTNRENMSRTNVDTKDNDNDGLSNYYESVLGTDPDKADTDGDGLTDYEEYTHTATDPLEKCTYNDGILDSDADPDSDGLSNKKELELGTNCLVSDTDGDTLKDGDEVNKYGTDPLKPDTDEDGLTDDKEIELGTDPTKADTDGNGVKDSDEKKVQTKSLKIDTTASNAGISEISVTLDCPGHIDDKVWIANTYDVDMRSSEVAGLIGVPANITCKADFETADITFKYDESQLGETDENDLRMLWYDDENDMYVPLDAVLDTENNTLTYKTTHFSTYLVIDKKVWIDTMRANIDYRNTTDTSNLNYYDLALVVDVSGSMSGERIQKAKKSLSAFISSMLDSDRAGIVKFNSYATRLLNPTSDRQTLQRTVDGLTAGGGTQAMKGLSAGLDMLIENGSSNTPVAILVCDGDVRYDSTVVEKAKTNGITVFCINVVNGSSDVLTRVAHDTGGEYYYAANNDDIEAAVAKLKGDTISSVDVTDTDGDGLYDVYEVKGMRMSNGKVMTSDPNKSDSILDGTSDSKSMGGAPTTETITIDGETFTSVLWHNPVYNKLSSKYMYVDGRRNENGIINNEKLDFIPCSDSFYAGKYTNTEHTADYKGEVRNVPGEAGEYEAFLDKLPNLGFWQLAGYAAIGTYVSLLIDCIDLEAGILVYQFALGYGGSYQGYAPVGTPGSTREIVGGKITIVDGGGINPILGPNLSNLDGGLINNANRNYQSNMNDILLAAESVLNEYNTDVYISLAPTTTWTGCFYNDTMPRLDAEYMMQCIETLCNIPAFGIYNRADAGGVIHCVYDPTTKTYSFDYKYMLIDYYNFPLLDSFNEMNVLGLAQSFELLGVMNGYGGGSKDFRFIVA